MLRFLSVLLVIAGLLAAGLGGAAMLEEFRPKEMTVETANPAASEMPGAPEADMPQAPAAQAASSPEPAPAMEAPAEAAIAIPESIAQSPEPAAPTSDVAKIESAIPVDETTFNFTTEMEEGPTGFTITPEPGIAPENSAVVAAAPAPAASFVDTLKTVPVAHETPRTAEYKRAFDVSFAIDATGDASAADALPGRGVIEEGEAKMSERVEVRVSGAAFDIVAASPPIQTLSPLTENTWRWSVTPMTSGEHDLVFEVFAIDADAVTPLRTFQDTVTVKVSGLNRAIEFADQANPLFVLLGGLGSALAGLLGAVKFFGKR